MPSGSLPESEPGLRFWRVLPLASVQAALDPVIAPEGRFHHSGQRALYGSPTASAAARAVARHAPAGLPRVAIPLRLWGGNLLDLRQASVRAALGVTGPEPSRPWRPERRAGLPATSWRVSDAARAMGASGLLYTARNAPHLWHLVLFDWNGREGAQLVSDGEPLPV